MRKTAESAFLRPRATLSGRERDAGIRSIAGSADRLLRAFAGTRYIHTCTDAGRRSAEALLRTAGWAGRRSAERLLGPWARGVLTLHPARRRTSRANRQDCPDRPVLKARRSGPVRTQPRLARRE